MVRTNGRTTKPRSNKIEEKDELQDEVELKFDIDPELLDETYNQVRRPILPYAIVINDNPAGIIIPEDQLEKANWFVMPEEDELTTITITDDVTGLFITEARVLVLGFVPEYIRYKADIPDLGNTVIGPYEEYRQNFDKKTMDAVSEHALVFLDENNRPLHSNPIVVRFKNVALWSFKAARDEFHRLLEKAFSEYFEMPFSGKNDKWRSLGVLVCKFKAVKEGEGKNKHFCCKTISYIKPTTDNLRQLYLGRPKEKASIWNLHDNIAGFTEAPALPAAAEPEVKVLPPVPGRSASKTQTSPSRSGKPPRKITQVEPEQEEDDYEAELEEDFDEADIDAKEEDFSDVDAEEEDFDDEE